MTTESFPPEVLHAWAICLQASEEARRRGDRRYGTDHILLALLENPSIEVVLGVSLQQARQALESLNHEALAARVWGPVQRLPHCRCAPCPKPKIRDVAQKDRLRITPAAKKVLEEASKPNRGSCRSRPSRCWPRSSLSSRQTLRPCCWALWVCRRGGSAPTGSAEARQLRVAVPVGRLSGTRTSEVRSALEGGG